MRVGLIAHLGERDPHVHMTSGLGARGVHGHKAMYLEAVTRHALHVLQGARVGLEMGAMAGGRGDPLPRLLRVAAHVAAQAGPGEILITNASAVAAGLSTDGLARRHLSLKGHGMDAVVLPVPSSRLPLRSP